MLKGRHSFSYLHGLLTLPCVGLAIKGTFFDIMHVGMLIFCC